MKDLVLFLVKSIVDNPKNVSVLIEDSEFGYTNIIVSVAKDDMGKVIGKGGKIIRALRILLRVGSIKEGKKFNLSLSESSPTTE